MSDVCLQGTLQRDPQLSPAWPGLECQVPAHPAPGGSGGRHGVRHEVHRPPARGRQGPPQVVHLGQQPEVALRSDGQDLQAPDEIQSIKYLELQTLVVITSLLSSVKENQSQGI